MTADLEADLTRLRTLKGAVQLNPGERITDVQQYVAAQEARANGKGYAARIGKFHLEQLATLTHFSPSKA